MDAAAFKIWLGALVRLLDTQRQRALQPLSPSSEAVVGAHDKKKLARSARFAARGVGASSHAGIDQSDVASLGRYKVAAMDCPHCGQRDVVRWGKASGLPRYRCKACLRTFNVLSKTPLARLRLKEKWAQQVDAMADGASLAKVARRCGVHYTTAFRWRHRLLAALSADKPKVLNGIGESEKAFIPASFKAKHMGLRNSAMRG